MSGRSRIVPFLLAFFIQPLAGHAQAAVPAGAGTGERLAAVMADPTARAEAAALGKRAAFLCVHCHGEDGNSPLNYVPNLAGQNPAYLLNQIDKFGDGRRKDEFMSGLVKALKPEDRFNMAVFYASQTVKPARSRDAFLEQAGARHFARACVGCHGAAARGNREVARLAGQQPVYVKNALEGYRRGAGIRSDSRMTGVAKTLSDPDIAALAAYLSVLR